MSEAPAEVSDHLHGYFLRSGIEAAPDVASVTFLGVERIDVLRFGPDGQGRYHYVSLGCSRYPMNDPSAAVADPLRGPRAEVVITLRAGTSTEGLARSLAVIAATPAVEGVVLGPDALTDPSGPLRAGSPFTAVLLGDGDIEEVALQPPRDPVRFLSAVPVTQTEAAWVRIKGAEAMRQAWADDGVDVQDPARRASSAG